MRVRCTMVREVFGGASQPYEAVYDREDGELQDGEQVVVEDTPLQPWTLVQLDEGDRNASSEATQ